MQKTQGTGNKVTHRRFVAPNPLYLLQLEGETVEDVSIGVTLVDEKGNTIPGGECMLQKLKWNKNQRVLSFSLAINRTAKASVRLQLALRFIWKNGSVGHQTIFSEFFFVVATGRKGST